MNSLYFGLSIGTSNDYHLDESQLTYLVQAKLNDRLVDDYHVQYDCIEKFYF